jgi:hypothetical protein
MEVRSMTRLLLDDGRWFDADKAQKWDEDTYWDGHNRISCATGTRWDHETLYRTAKGRWVLHWWSQWPGTRPSFREITPQEAASWLLRNGYDLPPELAGVAESLEV